MRLIDADALIPQEIHTVVIIRKDESQAIESVVFAEQVDNAPTIDALPVVHGKWEVKGQDIYCSACGGESAYTWYGSSKFSAYCPNCGAEMRMGTDMTNADRIRAMTDAELAEWINKHDCHTNLYGYDPKEAVLAWLKSRKRKNDG